MWVHVHNMAVVSAEVRNTFFDIYAAVGKNDRALAKAICLTR